MACGAGKGLWRHKTEVVGNLLFDALVLIDTSYAPVSCLAGALFE